ncbi:MAG TPA: DUF3108 domain-containing protein [Usitatibacter sp.]|nr:DUF3108 domain-containing protein [Usitatibacter sp.]
MDLLPTGPGMKLLAAFLLATAAQASSLPAEITAEYHVTNLGVKIGHMKESFVRKGDDYSIRSVTRAEGPLKMFLDDQVTLASSGKVGPQGLKPLHFEQRRARDTRRDVDATFDWQRGVLLSRYRGEQREIPLPRDTQDRLSLMYQLMRAAPLGGTMKIPMSNGRRVEVYTYRFVGEERVATPAGEFDTLHFERVTVDAKQNRADVWLAKGHSNFPVRIVFDDPDGLRLEQSLVALQVR